MALLLTPALEAAGDPYETPPEEPFVQVRGVGELGFLGVLSHSVQLGDAGTPFDYAAEGGQDVLFPFTRISAELELDAAHTFILLYQPLDLRTQTVLDHDLVVDEVTLPAGTPLDLRYGFDFYRFSYLYDFLGELPRQDVELGFSLQIRNAVIDFRSADGALSRSRRNIGPVPALKLRVRHGWPVGFWLGGELDGMYAPIKYINGGDSDVEGAILDISFRAGYEVSPAFDVFVNLRHLGGGAEGTGGDGFTSNWLGFFTASAGAIWTPTAML